MHIHSCRKCCVVLKKSICKHQNIVETLSLQLNSLYLNGETTAQYIRVQTCIFALSLFAFFALSLLASLHDHSLYLCILTASIFALSLLLFLHYHYLRLCIICANIFAISLLASLQYHCLHFCIIMLASLQYHCLHLCIIIACGFALSYCVFSHNYDYNNRGGFSL